MKFGCASKKNIILCIASAAVAIPIFAASAMIASAEGQKSEEQEFSPKVTKTLSGFERTGETRNCIGVRRLKGIKALDDQHFLVEASGNRYFLNVVGKGCVGASRSSTNIQYTTPSGRLCRNEIITVVHNLSGFSTGSCGMGEFIELRKKPGEEKEDS